MMNAEMQGVQIFRMAEYRATQKRRFAEVERSVFLLDYALNVFFVTASAYKRDVQSVNNAVYVFAVFYGIYGAQYYVAVSKSIDRRFHFVGIKAAFNFKGDEIYVVRCGFGAHCLLYCHLALGKGYGPRLTGDCLCKD